MTRRSFSAAFAAFLATACSLGAWAEFDPRLDISACVLWLDAADVQGEAPLACWPDKSGQGHDATQADADRQPSSVAGALNGKRVARFDGDDFLVTPVLHNWSDDWTLFVVASLDGNAPNTWRGIAGNRFGKGAANWWTLGTKSDGTCYLELGAGKGPNPHLTPGGAGAWLYSVARDAPQCALYRNGRLAGTAAVPDVGGKTNELRIGRWYGAGQEWDGDIAELLVYGRALGDSERKAVEAYLSAKWGVPLIPELYVRKETWAETMLASRAALAAYEASANFDAHGSPDWTRDLWAEIASDYPVESVLMQGHVPDGAYAAWFHNAGNTSIEEAIIEPAGQRMRRKLDVLRKLNAPPHDARWLELCVKAAEIREHFRAVEERMERVSLKALRLAIEDLRQTFPERYTKGEKYLRRLADLEAGMPELREGLAQCERSAERRVKDLLAFQRETLLANPLLDFKKLLLIRRSVRSPGLGLVNNWVSNCGLPRSGFHDEIAALSPPHPDGSLATLYRPEARLFVGDVDVHFDADRMLFSSIGTNDRWQVFEIRTDGTGLRQVTPGDQPDVDSYDACYLPDGRIMFTSNAFMAAVPCVNGSTRAAMLYRMEPDGSGIRQVCFDQEHNWCPTMLHNGRVMYLRWEYTDTPHSHDRVLFHMNPDGTGQMEYYGSNSYWPNALFYARPVPGHPTQFAGIVSGHHGVPRMGELVLFDPAIGRREADGAIQRIPGYGKKVASTTDSKYASTLIKDQLVDASWPKFLHPYPLSGKYFLVSCKPSPESLWGVYLADVFDNLVLIKEEEGHVLFEPIPLRATPVPPVIPDRVDLSRKDGLVYMTDIYAGGGLDGIPRGTVKELRLFTYHFLYPGMGGPQAVVGMEGPWDIKRVVGTVPIEEDGSALFRVPANTPLSVQPLDADGKALQLMRSWFTAMPGETLSCVGCHESQNSASLVKGTIASRRAPSEVVPWYGPTRGFNFDREVQPVLDRYCAGCHNGAPDGAQPDLKERKHITDYTSVFHSGGKDAGHFSVSYVNLHRYVRRPGLESDYHMLTPMEFHADTTQLVQMLRKGHGGVRLDAEAWDRIVTWIDLNAPFHGTWTEIAGAERVRSIAKRRRELLKLYANMDGDPEAIPAAMVQDVAPIIPKPAAPEAGPVDCPGWPFGAQEAGRRQQAMGKYERRVDLGNGLALELVLVPAGEFVMGDADGCPDERPLARVSMPKPFWLGRFEVTNEQFECYDPAHDSGVESRFSMQFGVRGFYVNGPGQPAVRVSWEEAMAFCEWLSGKTGLAFSLPTEAQWEYACRAGTASPFYYGGADTDFSPHANLADEKLREFVCHTYKKEREPWLHASKYDDWIPKDTRFNDGGFLSRGVGGYEPNAWGLHDMHGNVWEWTRSKLMPYPYREGDGRNSPGTQEDRVARGGSWRDRPKRARSGFRLAYRAYQKVYNVGFRVACAAE